ncbi:MAG: CHAT domain-containing protein [Mojavia pulchra JT2-VF2]|uniref:CHAT domain-containing protein n=1 Tax=Mojavia pulchra JT2-VF2 TaxID=287848 RepID=A0A951UFU6_9NOST|nr:CHAT domain-containing protein [Mojavia pulchra JT2-VF2]
MTRGFMYAGSPRAILSLWSVDDEATSELMKKFYSFMLQDALNQQRRCEQTRNVVQTQLSITLFLGCFHSSRRV